MLSSENDAIDFRNSYDGIHRYVLFCCLRDVFVLIRLSIYDVHVILLSLIILSSLSLKHAKNKVVIFRYLSEIAKTNMTVSRCFVQELNIIFFSEIFNVARKQKDLFRWQYCIWPKSMVDA